MSVRLVSPLFSLAVDEVVREELLAACASDSIERLRKAMASALEAGLPSCYELKKARVRLAIKENHLAQAQLRVGIRKIDMELKEIRREENLERKCKLKLRRWGFFARSVRAAVARSKVGTQTPRGFLPHSPRRSSSRSPARCIRPGDRRHSEEKEKQEEGEEKEKEEVGEEEGEVEEKEEKGEEVGKAEEKEEEAEEEELSYAGSDKWTMVDGLWYF